MATIFPRKNKDGTTTWRLMIRRKGLKPFITCFADKDDAINYANQYEKLYCLDPDNFTFDVLKNRRENEFKRKEL